MSEFIEGGNKVNAIRRKKGDGGPTLAEISRQLSEHLSTREAPRNFTFPERPPRRGNRHYRSRKNNVPY